MAPMTALRMVDIPSNAARLVPKPMLPNVAKRARMNIRRQKRAITWTRVVFGDTASMKLSDQHAGNTTQPESTHGKR